MIKIDTTSGLQTTTFNRVVFLFLDVLLFIIGRFFDR